MQNDHLATKPIVWRAEDLFNQQAIKIEGGEICIRYNEVWLRFPPQAQFDLTQATIFGLNERLTLAALSPRTDVSGITLRDQFNTEWEKYFEVLESEEKFLRYGYFVYYPGRKHIVHYSDPYWHKIVSVASNSMLYNNPEGNLSWREVRQIFDNTVVGVVGCSVGSNITHNIVMDLRPNNIKIADKVMYKMENINRVRLTYSDMVKSSAERSGPMDIGLRNKAEVVADQINSIDPFVNVYAYTEGITEETLTTFFDGDGNEPKIDILVEEIDDPQIKLMLRQEARKRKLPLIMASDMGSVVQVEVERYDLDEKLPLTYGQSDDSLIQAVADVCDNGSNRKVFFNFVDSLIGSDYRQGELLKIIEKKCEISTSTIIPQLGSTATASGAIVGEIVARLRLGYQYPPRFSFNKNTL